MGGRRQSQLKLHNESNNEALDGAAVNSFATK